MDQQRNGSPTRRGSGNRDGTIEPGAVGYERAMIEFIRRWHRSEEDPPGISSPSLVLLSMSFFVEHSSCFRPDPSRESMRKPPSTSARCVGGGSRPFVVDDAVFARSAR